MIEKLSICKCGCGERVTKPGNKFINGHNGRGVPRSPETCAKISVAHIGISKSPETCAKMSEAQLNSEAVKAAYENMRGGNDIVKHHWLYDDADLSKYTIPMTRSDHMSMHRRMQIDGYVVPHINSKTDDNGLWGYQ